MTAAYLGVLISASGMALVAAATILIVRRLYRPAAPAYRWFWVGAALWTIAVVPKLIVGAVTTVPMLEVLFPLLPFDVYVIVGGLCMGLVSALFEIGVTIAAALIWRTLGRDAPRAIAIGAGAGAFEALLLGLLSLAGVLAALASLPGTEPVAEQIRGFAESTPLFWLVAPTERVIAVLSHTASRALVLLGIAQRRWWMAAAGFAIFTALDGIAGILQVSDAIHRYSPWWAELSLAPVALVSLAALAWLHRRHHRTNAVVD